MRRFLAFVMCVSGFTLAVSWARADELAAAPTDDSTASPAAVTPSARPEIVRTEPGGYRQQDGQQSAGSDTQSEQERSREPLGDSLRFEAHGLIQTHGDAAVDYLQTLLDALQERASHFNDEFAAGSAAASKVESARSHVEAKIAEIEELQQRVAEMLAERVEQERSELPHEAQLGEQILNELRALAARLEATATDGAETTDESMTRQLEHIERYLIERRERRDASGDRPQRDAARDQPAPQEGDPAMRELHEKVRHLSAALEHLRAAGYEDLARETERRVQELTAAHQQARRHAAEAREDRDDEDRDDEDRDDDEELEPIRGAVRDLTNQVGELRRELRRLHREVDQLRRQHHEPDEERSERDAET